jgi:hypothetical protein
MGRPTPEGTTQIVPTGIARMGHEENPAVPTPGQAGAQLRLGAQHRSQQQIILQHQPAHRAPAVPVGSKLKMLLDLDGKKPKPSLKILTQNSMSPSYPTATQVSSG